jgi:hypothetical protein
MKTREATIVMLKNGVGEDFASVTSPPLHVARISTQFLTGIFVGAKRSAFVVVGSDRTIVPPRLCSFVGSGETL